MRIEMNEMKSDPKIINNRRVSTKNVQNYFCEIVKKRKIWWRFDLIELIAFKTKF